jgi:hypothetical protein
MVKERVMKKSLVDVPVLLSLIALMACMAISGCNNCSSTPSPAITSATNSQGGTTLSSGTTITISGTGFGTIQASNEYGQSYVCFVPQYAGATPQRAVTYSSWSDTQIQCIVPSLSPSTYQVQAVIAGNEGNTGIMDTYSSSLTPSSQNTITISGQSSGQPSIASIAPSPVNVGHTVTISGLGFGSSQGTGYVRFGLQIGGTTQYVTASWADAQIVCAVPATVSPGAVPVSVITGTGVESSSCNLQLLSSTAPYISAISPSSLAIGSTTPVTITGINFGDAMGTGNVTFQAGSGTPVSVTTGVTWTSTRIIATVPASLTASATAITVTVQANAGEVSNGFSISVGSSSGKIYALFVGINAYQDPSIPQLEWCVNDVTGMEASLTTSALWSTAVIVTLNDALATKSAIKSSISTMASQVTSADTFLFFYSGHGTNEGGHSYLVPVDSDLTTTSFIGDDELNGWLTPMNSAARKCIIFDSCNSGGFVGKGKDFRGRFLLLKGSDPAFKGSFMSRNMAALPNMVFLAAAMGSQLSVESSELQHGAFTYYLIQGLGSSGTIGPAGTGGTSITAQQVFTYATPLTSAFNASQTPQMQDNYTAGLLIKQ